MAKNVYSVRQVNAYIKNMFVQDFMLNRIYVKGEVSNCKYHTSGHIYFSLKDESGAIACVMFAGERRTGLSFRMQEGQKVIVLGSVSVYERDGQLSALCQRDPAGRRRRSVPQVRTAEAGAGRDGHVFSGVQAADSHFIIGRSGS